MPLPADSILVVLCGRIAEPPRLHRTDHERIPVLSFKLEVVDREPQLYEPIVKRVLLIGTKAADPAADPALRAAGALAPEQRVSVLGSERRREWSFGGVFMRGAQVEATEVRLPEPEPTVFRLGGAGDAIE